ncbi:MAG TPA: transglycosylase SLT domain-containing protein [Pyrinomonadaceae bacterium]|jgi:soluble lytic murein transglycosylase
MKKYILSIAFLIVFSFAAFAQTYNDATLKSVIEQDKTSRDTSGKLLTLPVTEHLYRADVYMSNRHFPEAREHFQKILDNYPTDAVAMPKVLFGTARSYMWERQYEKAVFWFDKLTKDYLNTKEGREGLAFKGASYVRLQKNDEAAKTYEQYIVMFPTGEKIESAYLNLIDALRELKKYDEANIWIDKTSQRFDGMPVETNALQARLRMEISRQNWTNAVVAADLLRFKNNFRNSMVSLDEVTYLKAFALEKLNRKQEAVAVYSSIPDSLNSYYSGLATEKLKILSPQFVRKTASVSANLTKDYPVLYRAELLRYAKSKSVDPRFVLAIMKQESSFRANAKSPAAARGLLQLVFDTALKYNKKAGFPTIEADDLYNPATNIAIGSLYMSDLKTQFAGMYEAVAASYNGGEDNVARWLKRSNPKDAAIFASEVGFAETKAYVFKVMNNYRIYRELYTEDLIQK